MINFSSPLSSVTKRSKTFLPPPPSTPAPSLFLFPFTLCFFIILYLVAIMLEKKRDKSLVLCSLSLCSQQFGWYPSVSFLKLHILEFGVTKFCVLIFLHSLIDQVKLISMFLADGVLHQLAPVLALLYSRTN